MENQPKQSHNISHHLVLSQMIHAYQQSQAIMVAAKLGIADLLKDGPKTCDELAEICQVHPEALYRLLRALASIHLFEEKENRTFSLTSLSHYLRSDVEGSLRSTALMQGDPYHWGAWGDLMEGIIDGKVVFNHKYKMSVYDYHKENKDFGHFFNQTMFTHTQALTKEILNEYDFSPYQTIVDVGGNHGYLLTSILQKYPNTQGILFDQPFVIKTVQNHIENNPVRDRIKVVAGNFFESIPANGEVYILKHIIHGFHDEKAVEILGNCRKAIKDHGVLLIIENVIDAPKSHPVFSRFLDLQMLVMSGGRERTVAEYEQLLEYAGFKTERIIPTQSGTSIIEAKPF
ncbi:methyltransferase [Thermoflavimicrobium dichotomicum]|uniref:Dimerisation domain-containing protein n=1 Tax=Thermoflavimicrobium dichotomicum TaxID=46223 RepID=A0A1I3TBT5_9BACL|nr:methyltransferase [Thermoflavimicrobium dichotomicum]SFJ67191.1 Dimerisation domain-containing protein [Thermoflavimicrobium dichotomicum]